MISDPHQQGINIGYCRILKLVFFILDDYSRVKLVNSQDESDYINASYVVVSSKFMFYVHPSFEVESLLEDTLK